MSASEDRAGHDVLLMDSYNFYHSNNSSISDKLTKFCMSIAPGSLKCMGDFKKPSGFPPVN